MPAAHAIHRATPISTAARADSRAPWWPSALLAVAVALFVAQTLIPTESAVWRGDAVPIATAWILVACTWSLLSLRQGTISLRFGLLDAAVVALALWYAASALVATGRAAPRPAINLLWQWSALSLQFLLWRQLLAGAISRRAVVVVALGLALALTALGLYQYFVSLPQTRAAYAADPDRWLQESGNWYPPNSRERSLFEQRLASREPLATFALANSFAGVLAPWLILGSALLIAPRLDQLHPTRARLALILFTLLVATCLLLTKSRAALLATFLASIPLLLASWRRPATAGSSSSDPPLVPPTPSRPLGLLILCALGLILLVAILAGGLDREVLTQAPLSLGYRLQYWQATTRMIADYPLLGSGPGNFGDAYTRYKLPQASEEISDPHNALFELAATAGLPAAILFLLILALAFLQYLRSPTDANTDNDPASPHSTRYVAVGAVLGFLVAALAAPLAGYHISLPFILCGSLILLLLLGSLSGFIQRGHLAPLALVLACFALLLNLLAAGGISFPAVAGTFWLLLALAVAATDPAPPRTLSPPASIALATLLLVLTIACYWTGYRPNVESQAAIRHADAHPAQASEFLMQATQADPLSAEPWRRLAAMHLQSWKSNRDPNQWRQFVTAADRATHLRPQASAIPFEIGLWSLQAHRETRDPLPLDQAIASLTRAVELYPHQAERRATLALALAASGQIDQARSQAAQAAAQSAATPHLDQQLSPEMATDIAPLLPSSAPP